MIKGITKTKKNGILYDEKTFMTNIPGVFAGGDCGNDKISIAIEAIADAEKATSIIDAYLNGDSIEYSPEFVSERMDLTEKDFEDRERLFRKEPEILSPDDRKNNFLEVAETLTFEDAVEEAGRCLSCGCGDYFECKLIEFANEYDIKPERFMGDMIDIDFVDEHPFIKRDPNKCILCGKCVRVCEEVIGVSALGFVSRGFDTIIKPTIEKPLEESGCVSCGQCVSVCPVGALQERLEIENEVPLESEISHITCPHCSIGCSLEVHSHGDLIIKANPDPDGIVNKGVSCGKGKFGFNAASFGERILYPATKYSSDDSSLDYYDAYLMTVKKVQALKIRYGKDSIAMAISPRYTNEEIFLIKKIARALELNTFSFSNRKRSEHSIYDIIGENISPNKIDELIGTELIIPVGYITHENPVIAIKLKEASDKGSEIISIEEKENPFHFDFAEKYKTKNSVKFIAEILKEIILTKKNKNIKGLSELEKDLQDISISSDAKKVAEKIMNAKKVLFLYQDAVLSSSAANMIANIALISGHLGKPRDGILIIRGKNNSQGLIKAGIEKSYKEIPEDIKGLIVFGEDDIEPVKSFKDLEFLATFDCVKTDLTEISNVVIPHNTPMSSFGTYLNTEGRLLLNDEVIEEKQVPNILEITESILNILEIPLNIKDELELMNTFQSEEFKYIDPSPDKINGIVNPVAIRININSNFMNRIETTDKLTKLISEKLPIPKTQPDRI
jgi:formate dehydrogenase major subunit